MKFLIFTVLSLSSMFAMADIPDLVTVEGTVSTVIQEGYGCNLEDVLPVIQSNAIYKCKNVFNAEVLVENLNVERKYEGSRQRCNRVEGCFYVKTCSIDWVATCTRKEN